MITINNFIKLDGFDDLSGAHMIILKKIMGQHIKAISERIELKELCVTLNNSSPYNVTVKVINGKEVEGSASDSLIFSAFDTAFKEVQKEL